MYSTGLVPRRLAVLGLVGGAFGSSSTAFGGLFGSIGSFLGISGAATLGIGAAIGGAALLAGFLFGRNAQRRRDEKTRNTAILDAFKALDDLIEKVNNDRIDGEQALSAAEDIRKNYLEQMNGLKDGKTRRIAIADVSRLDARIEQLKAAVANQKVRQERMQLLVPTFADGGAVSRFAAANYKYDPLGYQYGVGTGREDNMLGYFSSSDRFARYSNTEYILDAETTRNIGIRNLDMMRATRGHSFNALLTRPGTVNRADGGPVGFTTGGAGAGVSTQSLDVSKMSLVLNLNLTLGMETIVQVVSAMIAKNNGSSELIQDITAQLKEEGENEFMRYLLDYVNKNQ